MRRCVLVLWAVVGACAVPAAAGAAAPPATLADAHGSITLQSNGGCTSGPTRGLCGDPVPPEYIPVLPQLAVTPGEAMTITIDASWIEAPSATLTKPRRALVLTATGPFTYRLELPATLPPVSHL